jgi:hypothetical protein
MTIKAKKNVKRFLQSSHKKQNCPTCGKDLAFHSWGFACNLKGVSNKMAKEWQKVAQGEYNRMYTFAKKGDSLEGIYQGVRNAGEGVVHCFKVGKDLTDTWGKGKLNYLLKNVATGTEVKIVYLGLVNASLKIKGRNVKKDIHDFELFTR